MRSLGPAPTLPLFAYGTLLDSVFTARLLEREITAVPARLLDFELVGLEGLPYPTLHEAPGSVVEGRLFRRLSGEDYARLDAYEGVAEGLYRRIEVAVVARDPGVRADPEPAFAYMATEKTLRRYPAR